MFCLNIFMLMSDLDTNEFNVHFFNNVRNVTIHVGPSNEPEDNCICDDLEKFYSRVRINSALLETAEKLNFIRGSVINNPIIGCKCGNKENLSVYALNNATPTRVERSPLNGSTVVYCGESFYDEYLFKVPNGYLNDTDILMNRRLSLNGYVFYVDNRHRVCNARFVYKGRILDNYTGIWKLQEIVKSNDA